MSERPRSQTPRPRPRSGALPRVEPPKTAVVVDDHSGLREAITDALEHHGWKVKAFHSVEDALPIVRATMPDIVLTDINVGVMSGGALARELRLDRSTAKLRIVGMSGTCDPSPQLLSLFDRFLMKPIDLPGLDGMFRGLIETRG